ncbi:hypothetical protein [Desulfomonile tiedjei]|uniref:BioF2-like acetyltransferase domain-containing protein n=1 Tax=Desulfomonile tiedjei (strain ATCC 49306 / DSM 6799 / DCB-1) TaxID=706587 RepID=I4C720_DESTA|nr:hypothetical protein [Desulfomonile tiedjei]AFM25361.1 hypothetical protein Desti_2682 [Desulfomonile tiedjei DSM 6799]
MLTAAEKYLIYRHACVPEQVPAYVQAVSGFDPFLGDNYVYFVRGGHLLFVGYPLAPSDNADMVTVFETTYNMVKPHSATILTSRNMEIKGSKHLAESDDWYFRLDLPVEKISAENAYMVRRAARELTVCTGTFGSEHEGIVTEFCSQRALSEEHTAIFEKIQRYVSSSPGSVILEARKGAQLAAFNIVETGSQDFLYYLFNFRSLTDSVPGSSDLLFLEMIRFAEASGKKAINLGLGLGPGVRRFKEKWGAFPFLKHSIFTFRRHHGIWHSLTEFLRNLT